MKYDVTISVEYRFRVEAASEQEAHEQAVSDYHEEVGEGLNNCIVTFEVQAEKDADDEESGRLADEEADLTSKARFDGFLK